MVKVRLLADGSYSSGLEDLQYPIEVEGYHNTELDSVEIPGSELVRIGGDPTQFLADHEFIFFLGTEAELI